MLVCFYQSLKSSLEMSLEYILIVLFVIVLPFVFCQWDIHIHAFLNSAAIHEDLIKILFLIAFKKKTFSTQLSENGGKGVHHHEFFRAPLIFSIAPNFHTLELIKSNHFFINLIIVGRSVVQFYRQQFYICVLDVTVLYLEVPSV